MRIFIVDTYYPAFLDEFAARQQGRSLSYAGRWRALMDECFGTADYYSTHLKALGHESVEVVANDQPLQTLWARENGLLVDSGPQWRLGRKMKIIPWLRRRPHQRWTLPVLRAQIEAFRPDVLYFQDLNFDPEFVREMKPSVRLVAGQIASPVPATDLSCYDLILSSLPHFVERFRTAGLRSEYFRLGFEPRVLEKVATTPRYDASFVGGLTRDHAGRTQFLETVATEAPLDLWGYGVDTLRENSPLRRAHHGPAWALKMYRALAESRITLNFHIDLAQNNANNMRLYEATGVGAMLLTDWKQNLHEQFKLGREVVTYRSAEECAELIRYYLAHKEERAEIALAGQRRTLSEHTYLHRMKELVGILERYTV